MALYLLFDIGGTKMRIAFSNGKRISKIRIFETPTHYSEGVALLKQTAHEFSGGKKITAACGGVPGVLDKTKSRLVRAPHIKQWVGKSLRTSIRRFVEGPVYLENDAALVGLGEALYGAGQGRAIVVYYTVSTGVGGARIVDGAIDVSAEGFEPGHQIIIRSGQGEGGITKPRYLEEFVSGSGLMIRYQKPPQQITDASVMREVATWLAYGLNNSIVHWSPEIVVLGGGLIVHNFIPLKTVRDELKRIMHIYGKVPPLKKALLGDRGGLYGALALLNTKEG